MLNLFRKRNPADSGSLRLYTVDFASFGEFDREALRQLIRKVACPGCLMLEVGSWLGTGSTRVFIEELQVVGGSLYCVDTWKGNPNVARHQDIVRDYDVLASFRQNVRKLDAEAFVHPVVASSLEAARVMQDHTFDLVFLDGDHSYAATCEDISAWMPKVRHDGILCGHDCEARVTVGNVQRYTQARDQDYVSGEGTPFLINHPGVILAVDSFFKSSVHLWAEESLELEGGQKGPATIWDLCVGPDSSPGLR